MMKRGFWYPLTCTWRVVANLLEMCTDGIRGIWKTVSEAFILVMWTMKKINSELNIYGLHARGNLKTFFEMF